MRVPMHEEVRQDRRLVATQAGPSAQGNDEDVQASLDRG